ncbi:MAG: [protein-PII] uridylyltransferase [Pseudomonadales bacterium]|nr:[protein-PII] uridylyltransferase [Pseudomonadales bacterium]MDP6471698.1 [protein-PII] uridylyltransferase [Pseudomonadales bacterium]
MSSTAANAALSSPLAYRQLIEDNDEALAARYWGGEDIEFLVEDRAQFFDNLLTSMWREHFDDKQRASMALYAVGGYGRGELHPGSDIDLLIVIPRHFKARMTLEGFVRALFDLNIPIGHAVRTVRECRSEAQKDITVATSLLERRHLAGNERIVADLDKVMSSARIWPADRFFHAKRDEQDARHHRFDNVEYGLEPNIKASPGGLRDLQTALWVCLRRYGTSDPLKLEELGVISEQERTWLVNGKRFLWWVRYGLHLVAGRGDDRLQFEFQRILAQRLGYADTYAKLGVERFMHQYYRYVLSLREVNDIIFQLFNEAYTRRRRPKREAINDRFIVHDDYLDVVHEKVFEHDPSALLETFVILANRRDISGVRASTIRLIRNSLHLIDDAYRRDPTNTGLFIELLKAPYTLVTQLTRMRRYGVLGRYIPEFGEIIGQMQHDMFHIYTVDAHTMMVIRNMRRFFYRTAEEQFPVAAHCVRHVPKIELLYLAGLYHDIGKGRGGDHSELGAKDSVRFCQRHGLSDDDANLVSWLVQAHLVMSSTAQREDIYDPEVVHRFATLVKSERRLDYLYALTVADINATNPTLWNSWRATLMRQLYNETRKLLRKGLESPRDRQATVRACQEGAIDHLLQAGEDEMASIDKVWESVGDEFFLRHSSRQVADITTQLLGHDAFEGPLIIMQNIESHVAAEGATEIFLYTRDQPNLFAASVIALNRLSLSVHDAVIFTSESGICFNTYVVLGDDRQMIRIGAESLTTQLTQMMSDPAALSSVAAQRMPRRQKQLARASQVTISNALPWSSTLTIVAADRPGLLAEIGLLFVELNITVLSARITTLGERVEDVFEIQSQNGQSITDQEGVYTLENTLRQRLDSLRR